MKKIRILIVCFLILFLSACTPQHVSFQKNGTTCSNIVMVDGQVASYNNSVFFYGKVGLCEYDRITNSTVRIPTKIGQRPVGGMSMMSSSKELFFLENDGLVSVGFDGKNKQIVLPIKNEFANLATKFFVDGQTGYYMTHVEGALLSVDMNTQKSQTLISECVNIYHLSDQTLYAVQINGTDEHRTYHLLQTKKGKVDWKEIPLSFSPLIVTGNDNTLYVGARGEMVETDSSFPLFRYPVYICKRSADETWSEKKLEGVSSLFFQLCGEKLYFLDSLSYENSCFTLKVWNPETNDIRTVADDVYNFYVVDDHTVVYHNLDSVYFLYDTVEDTITEIPYPETNSKE